MAFETNESGTADAPLLKAACASGAAADCQPQAPRKSRRAALRLVTAARGGDLAKPAPPVSLPAFREAQSRASERQRQLSAQKSIEGVMFALIGMWGLGGAGSRIRNLAVVVEGSDGSVQSFTAGHSDRTHALALVARLQHRIACALDQQEVGYD